MKNFCLYNGKKIAKPEIYNFGINDLSVDLSNGFEINWESFGYPEYFKYYLSSTPMDINHLPEAKVKYISGDVRTYVDTAIDAGETYYVAVGSVKNGVEKISEVRSVSTALVQSYRYLRIYITANNGDTSTSLQEIEIANTVGGDDITTPSTPASQSSYFVAAGAVARCLVDNNFTEFQRKVWVSAATPAPHWVHFDLLTQEDLHELRMWPQNYESGAVRAPKDFVIQGSMDAVSWTDIKAFNDVTGWIAGTGKTFNLVTGTIT